MRKASALVAMIAFSAAFAAAGSIKNEAKLDSTDIIITETALLPAVVSPLAGLDLIPDPAPKAAYASMNLSPDQVSINPGHRYLTQGIRASQFGQTAFNVNLLAMVALNVADYISTTKALKCTGLAEGNPLMKPFVKSPIAFGAVKIGITALSYFGFKSMYKSHKPMAWILTTAANFFLGYTVSNNYRLIGRATR